MVVLGNVAEGDGREKPHKEAESTREGKTMRGSKSLYRTRPVASRAGGIGSGRNHEDPFLFGKRHAATTLPGKEKGERMAEQEEKT